MPMDMRDEREQEGSKAELRPAAIDLMRDLRGGGLPNPVAALEQLALLLTTLYLSREALVTHLDPWAELVATSPRSRLEALRLRIPEYVAATIGPLVSPETMRDAVPSFPSAELLDVVVRRLDGLRWREYLCADLLDVCLDEVSVSSIVGSPRTPAAVSACLVGLTAPREGERVLDPAVGSAERLLAVARSAARDGQMLGRVLGIDSDAAMVRLGVLSLAFHGVKEVAIDVVNTFAIGDELPRFDAVLCQPPFGLRVDPAMLDEELRELARARSEVLFAERSLSILSPYGRAAIVLPANVAYSRGAAPTTLRRRLVEAGLRAVITLPGGTFQPHTSVETIIVSTGPQSTGTAVFVDATEPGGDLLRRSPAIVDDLRHGNIEPDELEHTTEGRCFVVPYDTIAKNGYSLQASTYRPRRAAPAVTESPLALLREIEAAEQAISTRLDELRRRLTDAAGR
jgi:type I restriction enzyme M protein